MKNHPHTSRYARLVAGFAASAFTLLIASAVHYAEAQNTPLTGAVSSITKDCARTRKALDKCAVRSTKCKEKAAVRQPACIKKAEARMVKCSDSATKKLNTCQAKADTQEKLAKCSKKFDDSRLSCGTTYDKTVAKCGSADEASARCDADKFKCEADALEKFQDKTGTVYEDAC